MVTKVDLKKGICVEGCEVARGRAEPLLALLSPPLPPGPKRKGRPPQEVGLPTLTHSSNLPLLS